MQRHNVKVGSTYIVKVSGTLAKVRITREHVRGGGTNQSRHRSRDPHPNGRTPPRGRRFPAPPITEDEARRIV